MSMTVEQALKIVAVALSSDRTSDEERLAFAVLRTHIERELTVSDVDKAVIVFYGSKHVGSSDYAAMQAAIRSTRIDQAIDQARAEGGE